MAAPSTAIVDTRAVIETPENVPLTLHLAGPGSRMAAYVLDVLFRVAIVYGANFVLSLMIPVLGMQPVGVMLVVYFCVEWGYTTVFEGLWNGQTPGKRIYRLRVIKDGGYPISFNDAAIRNLLRAADALPFGYASGFVCMLATPQMQRIGDLAAGTIVVVEEPQALRRNLQGISSVTAISRSECDGQYQVSERTLDVVERLFDAERLPPPGRTEEIATILAAPIATRMGYHGTEVRESDGRYPQSAFLRSVLRTFVDVDHSGNGSSTA